MDAFAALVDRKPATDTVILAANPDDAPKLTKARLAVARAETREQAARTPEAKAEAAGEVEDARALYDALKGDLATITFHLQGIGPHVVEEIMRAHPATKEQKATARKANNGAPGNGWNDDTFPPAMLAACVTRIVHSDDDVADVDGIDIGQATAIWRSTGLPLGDKSTLFLTTLGLDQRDSGVGDLGND